MSKNVLADWLGSDKDYSIGLELLKQLEPGSYHVEFLSKHSSLGFAKKKLIELLEEYRNQGTVAKAVDTSKINASIDSGKPERIEVFRTFTRDDSKLPEEIKPIAELAKQRYKEAAAMYAQLSGLWDAAFALHPNDIQKANDYLLANGSGRKVNEYLDKCDEFDRLFVQVNYYNEHLKMPDPPVISSDDLPDGKYELQMQLQACREFISKNKKKPKRASEVVAMIALRDATLKKLNELI